MKISTINYLNYQLVRKNAMSHNPEKFQQMYTLIGGYVHTTHKILIFFYDN